MCAHKKSVEVKVSERTLPVAEQYISKGLAIGRKKTTGKWFHLLGYLFIRRNGLCHLTVALSDKEGLGMGGGEGRMWFV